VDLLSETPRGCCLERDPPRWGSPGKIAQERQPNRKSGTIGTASGESSSCFSASGNRDQQVLEVVIFGYVSPQDGEAAQRRQMHTSIQT
jgi:hypothetical protein